MSASTVSNRDRETRNKKGHCTEGWKGNVHGCSACDSFMPTFGKRAYGLLSKAPQAKICAWSSLHVRFIF